MEQSLCSTCNNIFDFPDCCEVNLQDEIKVIRNCRNYNKCGEIRDCLSCSNSFSEPSENSESEDILHCMEQDGKVVSENGYCNKWN